jgi:hypothetical protein
MRIGSVAIAIKAHNKAFESDGAIKCAAPQLYRYVQ